MYLVDTHTHLTFEPIWSQLGDVLERAGRHDVQRVLAPAYDLESWGRIRKLLSSSGVYGAFGVHPWKADEALNPDDLQHAMGLPHAVAIGEIGLDFKVASPSPEVQTALFRMQLELAISLNKPVMLHCRGAFMEMIDILKSYAGKVRGVVHAFSRGPDLAETFVRLGLHIGFGGAITRSNATRARAAATTVPWERIVLETDSPSIGVEGVEPEKTEPMHIALIAAVLAQLRRTDVAHVADVTTRNAELLFGLPPGSAAVESPKY
ncbi:MAG: TatD family hydrolase [Deltaproteobacteria bacterium]|nr:TatD family hydrolase [Deltaproteobacteria bacterium]